jgi:hypothetical protein
MNRNPGVSFDIEDARIVAERFALLNQQEGPRNGDFVDFADGVTRRVSHVYGPDWKDMAGVQTSDGGSWYLDEGWCSFSGSLYGVVKMTTLTLTDKLRPGLCWIFHHNYHTAHNGVDVEISFRVYKCSENATR